MPESFDFTQEIFKSPHPAIHVDVYDENEVNVVILNTFLTTVHDGAIGIASAFGSKCALSAVIISSGSNVLGIRFSTSKPQRAKRHPMARKGPNTVHMGRELLRDLILTNPNFSKYIFEADKLAASLHIDLGICISNAIDMLSAAKSDRCSLEAFMEAIGGKDRISLYHTKQLFAQKEASNPPLQVTAHLAWISWRAAMLPSLEKNLLAVHRIDTTRIQKSCLDLCSKTIRDADCIITLKPHFVIHEIDSVGVSKKGNIEIRQARFKTRMQRTAANQTLLVETVKNGKRTILNSRVESVKGRTAIVSGSLPGGTVKSLRTVGREMPTSAEACRAEIMLNLMQGTTTILEQPFVQRIWFPNKRPFWSGTPRRTSAVKLQFSASNLNISQRNAVEVILSNKNKHRVILIHGPPGTGKTTVIAAATTSIIFSEDKRRTLWLVAQSNVAVKNIAEKLASVEFLDFKLLVSKDFHFEWHEHLYEKIGDNVIRSEKLAARSTFTIERLLDGSRVILCTLSMLSHKDLQHCIRLVPPQTLIFDEASQIEIGNYFPMLHRFRNTIEKLVFIGDNKQLAPYGQSDIPDLRSIFEMPHLHQNAIFLDTQYRMPRPIGDFISKHVYGDRLKTAHKISSRASCRFIDINDGNEVKQGCSWTNVQEVQAVEMIARKLHTHGKSYRVITPYDAQRSKLENALKAARLPWEDKCFNVDSFQGNEDDYIVVSLVRSKNIGFLQEKRRVNVMLTRCKKGMLICSSRNFVHGAAAKTLVGLLASSLGAETWINRSELFNPNFIPLS